MEAGEGVTPGKVVGRKAIPNNHIMRKSIITWGVAALVATSADAQTKGFISGQMSVSSTSSPDDNAKTLNGTFGPMAGFNLSEKLILGLGVDYSGTTVTNRTDASGITTETDRKSSLLTIAPFARYMKKVDEDFSLFGQLSIGVGFGGSTDETVASGGGSTTTVEVKNDVNTFSTTIGPGVQYAFAPHWAVTANWGALRYQSRTTKLDEEGAEGYTQNEFGLALTPGAITFGLNWLF